MADKSINTTGSENNVRDDRTWIQKNGGTVFGVGTFVLLGLITFIMWLSNTAS